MDNSQDELYFGELIKYLLVFTLPIILFGVFSYIIALKYYVRLLIDVGTLTAIILLPFTIIVFALFIPYLKKRESTTGVRYSIFAAAIMGIFFAIPSALKGNFNLLLTQFVYVATFIFITFIYSPEVLGIERNIAMWFSHYKHLFIVAVYMFIFISYVIGFGQIYNDIYLSNPTSFDLNLDNPTYGTFAYFSLVTFSTLGYGDIIPLSTIAKMVMSFEVALGAILNILFVAILLAFITSFSSEQKQMILKEELRIESDLKIKKKRRKNKNG